MTFTDWVTVSLVVGGCFFLVAGSIGMLRLPDIFSRLHATTKADNLGLGLIVAGLLFQSNTIASAMKLGLIWALVIVAGSTVCHLFAKMAFDEGIEPWSKS